jgi:monoamine oxidase
VALPLGVLQAGSVAFAPEPVAVMEAARKLAAGAVQRLVLRFRRQFWVEGMRFLFTADEMPSTWWTTWPHASGVLTGWVGGPRSLSVDAEGLLQSGLRSLERVFSLAAGELDQELLGWHTHDWQRDPYSLGAYSYAPAGAAGAAAEMAMPVEGTLFFAGEHTDVTGHPGTVHGALRSGLRAAEQVLGVLAG